MDLQNGLAYTCKNNGNKTGVINDPLGQTHNLDSSENCFVLLDFENRRTDGRTCVKTIITTGCDCGAAEWFNNLFIIETLHFESSVSYIYD